MDIEDILRRNPKAAAGVGDIKGAIEALKELRGAGLGGGGYALLPPFGGRAAFKETLNPNLKRAKAVSKVTFGA